MTALPFIYPYLHTGDDGADLRRSLRSLDRFLHLDGSAYPLVAGNGKPSWLLDEYFIHVPLAASPDEDRLRNVVCNVVKAAEAVESDRFIYMNDDFVLMEPRTDIIPLHAERWSDWYRNVRRWNTPWYLRAASATDELVGSIPGAHSWELHLPMPMYTAEALNVLNRLLIRKEVAFPRTVYGTVARLPGRKYAGHDARLDGRSFGSSWVSLIDRMKPWIVREVDGRLTMPSRWEG